jgi:hypothetical protein
MKKYGGISLNGGVINEENGLSVMKEININNGIIWLNNGVA